MRFTPKTEKEIEEANLLPKGQYDAEIIRAEEKVSKSTGRDMIELQVKLFNKDGDYHATIYDYLMESVAYKLRHAASACYILDRYESGELSSSDFEGKCVRVDLIIQQDKTGQYRDKNMIKDYLQPVTAGGAPKPVKQAAPAGDFDDDIPF